MTKTEIERERAHLLGSLAAFARHFVEARMGRSHLDCAYCAHLAKFYNDQRAILQTGRKE